MVGSSSLKDFRLLQLFSAPLSLKKVNMSSLLSIRYIFLGEEGTGCQETLFGAQG